MKKTGILFLALVAVFLWVAPSFAGKKALNEDDLDRITAAGQPTVVSITNVGSSTASVVLTFENLDSDVLDVQSNSQNALRALAVNNIIGENQIANAINIQTHQNGNQSNIIIQSWGSIDVTGVTTVATSSSGNATINATATPTLNATNANTGNGIQKVVGINSKSQTTTVTVTGNTLNAAAVAVALAVPQFIAADQIILINNVSSAGAASTTLDFENVSADVLTLESNSQNTLAALVVNNIVGKNQIANAINIASNGDITINSAGVTIQGTAFGASGSNNQSNFIQQFRGAPLNAFAGPVGIGIGATAGAVHGVGVSGPTVTPF